MIDREQTIQKFGYDPDIYSDGSHKRVVAICPVCGESRSIAKREADRLCIPCDLQRRGGVNHPMYGKHHSEKTKIKLRAAKQHVTEETRKKMSDNHADVSGENNPMYGTHRCGKDNPRFGVSPSEETREKIRIANTGKFPSIETRKLMGDSRRGEKNWNWKGGISSERDKFRSSTAFRQWRTAVFERDCFTCRECGSSVSDTLNAHHILPMGDWQDPQFSLNIMNGITLCEDCHKAIRNKEYEFFSKYFDIANGVKP